MSVGQNGVHHPLAVQVGAGDGVEAVAQEPFGLAADVAAIGAGERTQVELEARAGRQEAAIVGVIHIIIPLRMGEDGLPAGAADAGQQAVQVHRRREAAGLHEQGVAALPDGEEVAGGEALGEEAVKHIFRCELQADGTGIGGLQLRETLPQVGGPVGDVFHDVGGEPERLHPLALEPFEHAKGLVEGADAIIDPREDMTVEISQHLYG